MDVQWLNGDLGDVVKSDLSFIKNSQRIATDIEEKRLSLTKFVEGLGSVLTDVNPEVRKQGTCILSKVLQNLASDFLNENEVEYIISFYCDRLKDNAAVIPAVLQGLLAVLQMENLPSKLPRKVLTQLADHIQSQSQLPSDRLVIYNILYRFIVKYLDELRNISQDFIHQVISTIDGESEPRNLIFLFSNLMPLVLQSFVLGHLAEDTFEVLACYFPIDYYTSSKSPSSVSREELANGLAYCLSGSHEFAEFCFPLIFDKLDSSRKVAKLDSFFVMELGLSAFPIKSIKLHLSEIMSKIKTEVLPGTDKDVREAGLAALKALILKLSSTTIDDDKIILKETVQDCITAAENSLKEVDLNSFLPAVRLLLSVCEASAEACNQITAHVIPALQYHYNIVSKSEQKIILLQTLTSFISVSNLHNLIPQGLGSSELNNFWSNIPQFYLMAAEDNDSEVQRESLHGISITVFHFGSNYCMKLYDIIAKMIKYEDNDVTRQEATKCLQALSKFDRDNVLNIMILSKLKVNQGYGDESKNDVIFLRCQEALCEIADQFISHVVPEFLNLVIYSQNVYNCLIGVKCLWKLLKNSKEDNEIVKYLHFKCDIVSKIATWWFKNCYEEKLQMVFSDEVFRTLLTRVLCTIISRQPVSVQNCIIETYLAWFIVPLSSSINMDKTLRPLDPESPSHHTQLVVLLQSLIGSVRREAIIPGRFELILALIELSIKTNDYSTLKSSACLVGNLINKTPDGEELIRILNSLDNNIESSMTSNCNSLQRRNAAHLCVWVTKALVMRGHGELHTWVNKLMRNLEHEDVSHETAEGFKTIMNKEEDFFKETDYCNVKLLFCQRFFLYVTQLVNNYYSSTLKNKSSHLLALMYMLQGVPKPVLLMDIPKIILLLLESLTLNDITLLLSTMETLETLLEIQHQCIADHMNSFISKLLQLSKFEKSMKVRKLALHCLFLFCQYPTVAILPFKNQVVNELKGCLDDKKRLVRIEAVKTQLRWYVVGSPGEPNVLM